MTNEYKDLSRAGLDAELPAIETFPNQYSGYEITIEIPEFTSVCPLTTQPDFGTITLQDKKKNIMTIYNQNENLIAWVSNKSHPVAIGPDLICYMTTDGVTFSNADLDLAKGKEVAVIGCPCTPQLRAPKVMAAWTENLKSIGYAGQYIPIEEIWGRKKK